MSIKWMYNRTENSYTFGLDIEISQDNQSIVTWEGKGYTLGINMLDVYHNGQYRHQNDYIERNENSIEFLYYPPSTGDIISIRYRIGNINLGNIRVVSTYSNLLNSPNPVVNEVAIVTATKRMYIYTELGWREFVIPFTTQNVGTMFQHETQPVISESQLTYTLSQIHYPVGSNALLVFIDGKKVDPDDYIEVDSTTITFNSDLPTGSQEVEFLVANQESWDECISHTVEYDYDTEGNILAERVKINANIIKSTLFQYNLNGDVVTETITKDTKVIIKTYEYIGENISKVTVIVQA